MMITCPRDSWVKFVTFISEHKVDGCLKQTFLVLYWLSFRGQPKTAERIITRRSHQNKRT